MTTVYNANEGEIILEDTHGVNSLIILSVEQRHSNINKMIKMKQKME